jgi:hypothetical protein
MGISAWFGPYNRNTEKQWLGIADNNEKIRRVNNKLCSKALTESDLQGKI